MFWVQKTMKINWCWMFLFLYFCAVFGKVQDIQGYILADKQKIIENETLTLTCYNNGTSSSFVSFKRITADSDPSVISTSITSNNSKTTCDFGTAWDNYQINCTSINTVALIIREVGRLQHNDSWQCSFSLEFSNTVKIYVEVPVTSVDFLPIIPSEDGIAENTTLHFQCITSYSRPVPTIQWFLSSETSDIELAEDCVVSQSKKTIGKYNVLTSVNSTLIFNTQRSMNGDTLYCSANNTKKGDFPSVNQTLNITYPPDGPPRITGLSKGKQYNVIDQTLGNLSCLVTRGNPLPLLKWNCLFNGSQHLSQTEKALFNSITWTASVELSGMCTCQSTYNGNTSQAMVEINVLYPPEVPTIQLQHGNVTRTVTRGAKLIENKSYNLSCIATGNPLPTNYSLSKPHEISVSSTGIYALANVNRTHNGTYSCRAQNVMKPTDGGHYPGENYSSINIDILYKPEIAVLNNTYVAEGSSRNITCEAVSANPPETEVIWTKDKLVLEIASRVLILNNISRQDSMDYTCTMKNNMTPTVGPEEQGYDSETFHLTVWYRASVKRFVLSGHENENPAVVNESTGITFTCEIDSNPSSTVNITLPNGTISSYANTNLIKYSYLLSSCLDSGIYMCSGSNDYNNGQPGNANISLLVNCIPMAFSHIQEDIRSRLYAPVTLQFTVIAYPEPKFTWEIWTNSSWTQTTNTSMFYISSSGKQSNLTVNNFTSTEVNHFRLIVENFMGRLIQNYTLQPVDRPNQPTEFSHNKQLLTDTSVTLLWKPGFNGGTPQNFTIKYRSENDQEWEVIILQDTGKTEMNITINGLARSTYYEFQIVATNKKSSSEKVTLIIQTKEVKMAESIPVGSVAGITTGVTVVIVVVVVFGILLYRKRSLHGKESETGKLIYQNVVPFTGQSRKKKLSAKTPTKEETSFHALQELDDAPPLYREPTEYYNSPEKIEQIDRIQVSELLQYVLNRSEESFCTDYQKLPTGLQKPCVFARKPENIALNRYNGIYPYDHSRVTISGQPDFFINACYIEGYAKQDAYIASLGPTKKVTYDFKTFWMMVWNEQSDIIVMLTNLTEPSGMKCEQYWPELGTTELYGDLQVSCDREEVFAEYTMRSLTVSNADDRRSITHLHYTAWPDKKVPEDVTTLIEFRQRLKATPSSKKGPIVIHCSAGIGRTGTLIALDRLIEEGQCNGSVNVFECVNSMREQRVKMVQTLEQYIYIYKALVNSLYFDSEMIPVESFEEYVHDTNNNMYSRQFQQLKESVETFHKEELDARAGNETLVRKNRNGADVPGCQNRIFLYLNTQTDESNYINAVYVNSFKKKDHFIVAQSPLPSTACDFVSMIYQEKCCCVVTMEDLKEPGMSVGQYLPSDGHTLKFGEIKVSSTTLDSKPQYSVREMRIKYTGKYESGERVAYHFQYKKWMQGNDTPANANTFVQFIKDVGEYADQLGEKKSHVLVHCLKANERSALYCVVSILMEKMRYERQVSVLNTVRHLRTRRRSAITSMEQLKFCYQAVREYIKMIEV